jgi:hypothetical protein
MSPTCWVRAPPCLRTRRRRGGSDRRAAARRDRGPRQQDHHRGDRHEIRRASPALWTPAPAPLQRTTAGAVARRSTSRSWRGSLWKLRGCPARTSSTTRGQSCATTGNAAMSYRSTSTPTAPVSSGTTARWPTNSSGLVPRRSQVNERRSSASSRGSSPTHRRRVGQPVARDAASIRERQRALVGAYLSIQSGRGGGRPPSFSRVWDTPLAPARVYETSLLWLSDLRS